MKKNNWQLDLQYGGLLFQDVRSELHSLERPTGEN